MILKEIKKFEPAFIVEKKKINLEFNKLDQCNSKNSLISSFSDPENIIQIKFKVEKEENEKEKINSKKDD